MWLPAEASDGLPAKPSDVQGVRKYTMLRPPYL